MNTRNNSISKSSENAPFLPGTLTPSKTTTKQSSVTACLCFTWYNIFTPLIWFVLVSTLLSLLTGAWWMGKQEHQPYVLPLALLSVLPSVFFIYILYAWKNRNSCPLSLVIGCYIAGILACAPVAIIESFATMLFFPTTNAQSTGASRYTDTMTIGECIGLAAVSAFVVAAFCEESFKFLFITWRAFDESSGRFLTTYGIVVLSIATSLGFATLENATYVLAPHTRISDAFETAAWRSLMSVPLHVVCGAFCGWAVARRQRANPTAPWEPRSAGAFVPLWLAFGIPFFIHGLFDFVLELTPAVTPFLTKEQINTTTYMCIGIAASIVVLSGMVVAWLVYDLHHKTRNEKPREEASAWPSIESIEEGAGCASGRETIYK
jgi:RsiW-degrading membrane proteinase PrsW (M82 family)